MQGYMLAAIGVSHGGKTTKIHAVVDALGNPAHFLLTGGNIFDAQCRRRSAFGSENFRKQHSG